MSAACPFCEKSFVSSRGIFGQDAEEQRDAHALTCESNPRNRCFCGRVFPSNSAKEKHAATCHKNPSNQFKCTHCSQEFLNTFGMMGRLNADGKALRDAHVVTCKDNPANICFCGNVFANPEARNAHAVTCDMNPANRYECQFCQAQFVKTFNMFGFCSRDGRADRDAHQVSCERNPKNLCFCGKVFPNPTARDRHATTCQENPVNRFQCSFCKRLFVTRFGVMGRIACDGKALRDSHEVGCEKNPANTCFCGQLFLNPSARDAHAVKCEMNPVNRFSCQYCRKTFVSTFGIFSSSGSIERDAHVQFCSKNPANATCEHCNRTFADTKGPLSLLYGEAHRRCEHHVNGCRHNPKNRFSCDRCGKCFVTSRQLFFKSDGRRARDQHHAECDLIPCQYDVRDSGIDDWLLMSSGSVGTGTTDVLNAGCASQRAAAGDEDCALGRSDDALSDADDTLCQPCLRCDTEVTQREGASDAADLASFSFHDAESSQGDESEKNDDADDDDDDVDDDKEFVQADKLDSESDSGNLDEDLAKEEAIVDSDNAEDSDSELEASFVPLAIDSDFTAQCDS